MCVNETKIGNKALTHPNYNILGNDRQHNATHGGGVTLYVYKNIKFEEILTNSNLQEISILINQNQLITALYISPTQYLEGKDLDALLTTSVKCVIVGDLNAKQPMWNNSQINANDIKILQYSPNKSFNIEYPNEPARYLPPTKSK